jgi:hypothetical protein
MATNANGEKLLTFSINDNSSATRFNVWWSLDLHCLLILPAIRSIAEFPQLSLKSAVVLVYGLL